jgi:hypothetical protein
MERERLLASEEETHAGSPPPAKRIHLLSDETLKDAPGASDKSAASQLDVAKEKPCIGARRIQVCVRLMSGEALTPDGFALPETTTVWGVRKEIEDRFLEARESAGGEWLRVVELVLQGKADGGDDMSDSSDSGAGLSDDTTLAELDTDGQGVKLTALLRPLEPIDFYPNIEGEYEFRVRVLGRNAHGPPINGKRTRTYMGRELRKREIHVKYGPADYTNGAEGLGIVREPYDKIPQILFDRVIRGHMICSLRLRFSR